VHGMSIESGVYLRMAGVLAGFFLKIAGACVSCLILSLLSHDPRRRFLVWLAFIGSCTVYWGVVLLHGIRAVLTSDLNTVTGSDMMAAPAYHPSVPIAWAGVITILGRIAIGSYLGIFLILITRALWNHVRLHFVLQRGVKPPRELQELFAAMCRQFGVRHCELLILPDLKSPSTVYWRRPRILLPEMCRQPMSLRKVANVLHHELVHIRRRDYLLSAVADAACYFLFFHPAVWQARRQMRFERELACDFAVVAARPDFRAEYAECLTTFARLSLLPHSVGYGIDFSSAASLLTLRIQAILMEREKSSWWERLSRATACMTLLAVSFTLFPALAIFPEFALPTASSVEAAGPSDVRVFPGLHVYPVHGKPLVSKRAASMREFTQPAEVKLIHDTSVFPLTATTVRRDYEADSESNELNVSLRGEHQQESQHETSEWEKSAPTAHRASTMSLPALILITAGRAGKAGEGRPGHRREGDGDHDRDDGH